MSRTLVLCHGRSDRRIVNLDYYNEQTTFVCSNQKTNPDICAKFPKCTLNSIYDRCLIVHIPFSQLVIMPNNPTREYEFTLSPKFWIKLNQHLTVDAKVYIFGIPDKEPYILCKDNLDFIEKVSNFFKTRYCIKNNHIYAPQHVLARAIKNPEKFGFKFICESKFDYVLEHDQGISDGIIVQKIRNVQNQHECYNSKTDIIDDMFDERPWSEYLKVAGFCGLFVITSIFLTLTL